MTLSRLVRFVAAVTLSVAVIVLAGLTILALAPVAVLTFPILVLFRLPNPMILIAWPWSLAIVHVYRALLNVRFTVEVQLDHLRKRDPVICLCNHPPAAFFPMVVWAAMAYVRMWPLFVSKASNLWNPILAPFVVIPALLIKSLVVTKRGNGWGARMVAWSTRLLVTQYSVLIIFADAHRPESTKARKDYMRMLRVVPQIEWHQRLGAYHYQGAYAAIKTLGPTTQIVAMAFSFPRGAVSWLAPLRVMDQTLAFRLRNVTERFQKAMIELGPEGGKPVAFINELNRLVTQEDEYIASINP